MATNVISDAEKMSTNENPPTVKTISVTLVKNSKKRMHVMQFNETRQVKFADWKEARLQCENNSSLYNMHRVLDEPKFGAGPAFGRVEHQEARHRRSARKYKPEDQPWILKTSSTDCDERTDDKCFKGIREGGVGENSTYYIFVMNPDGKGMSAYPIQDWYKFRSIRRYKTLSVDEAEEEFARRNERLNYFSLMAQKRLRNDDDNEDAGDLTNVPKKSNKELKISEMDEWDSSDVDESNSGVENSQPDNDRDKKKKKKANLKKRKNASDHEAFEESDDGDEEGRECEYITDSSAAESDLEQQKEEGSKSVAEETGLKDLLGSDIESQGDESIDRVGDRTKKHKKRPDKEKSARGADKCVNLQGTKKEYKSAGGNLLGVADDEIDGEDEAKIQKRTTSVSSDKVLAKRYKREPASKSFDWSYICGASESGITVEAVSRYLKRKPMTLKDLLKKFKLKKTGLSKDEFGQILMLTLQKIKLNKRKINGVTYYSL